MTPSITILDDEPLVAESLNSIVSSTGNACVSHTSPELALQQVEADRPQLVITDLMMPEMNGLEMLRRVKLIDENIHVVVVTGYGSVELAVAAIRAGASDFITKPYKIKDIQKVIRDTLARQHAPQLAPFEDASRESEPRHSFITGRDEQFQSVLNRALTLASTLQPVLITGGPGVGKETIARRMHVSSPRSQGAFISVNCAVIPEDAVERELFAPEGCLKRAQGGSLYLEGFEALPHRYQTALLEKIHDDVNSGSDRSTDERLPRIFASSALSFEAMRSSQAMTAPLCDLFEAAVVEVPSLSARAGDLGEYAHSFLVRLLNKYARNLPEVPAETLEALRKYNWPGNLSELENVLERALILAREPILDVSLLPPKIFSRAS
jgi:DNA-binding NtrC family response regulator